MGVWVLRHSSDCHCNIVALKAIKLDPLAGPNQLLYPNGHPVRVQRLTYITAVLTNSPWLRRSYVLTVAPNASFLPLVNSSGIRVSDGAPLLRVACTDDSFRTCATHPSLHNPTIQRRASASQQ
jgi:hypothetical protein